MSCNGFLGARVVLDVCCVTFLLGIYCVRAVIFVSWRTPYVPSAPARTSFSRTMPLKSVSASIGLPVCCSMDSLQRISRPAGSLISRPSRLFAVLICSIPRNNRDAAPAEGLCGCAFSVAGCCRLRGCPLSVAAFWAGAAHPRRQKHREMPPPGASAPAFAATAEHASCPLPCNIQGKTRAGATDGTRAGGCAEDGLLRASILDFRPRLGNRCKVLPVYAILRASILDFRLKLENRCRVFPGNAFQRASILDFKPRLGNRCKVFPVYTLFRASILDFKPRLGNRCKVLPVYALLRSSILDFKPRLENRCKVFPVDNLLRSSIHDINLKLQNICKD